MKSHVTSQSVLFVLALTAVAPLAVGLLGCGPSGGGGAVEIVNASYDPTRQLYQEINPTFQRYWQQKTGQTVKVSTSNAGSAKQARAVIDGLKADVVTLALAYDIDMIARQGKLLADNWLSRLPNKSSPYTSTIVFLVRKGNPKGIHDWDDLVKAGVQVVTPDPQTSGGARWNYMAAWGFVLKRELGSLAKVKDPAAKAQVAAAEKKAREFMARLFQNVPVLDTGARGATLTFAHNHVGDVLLGWENECLLEKSKAGGENFEIVLPSLSIRAEPPVAVVDKIVDQRGTRQVAEGYLKFLYTPEAQEIEARHFFRPSDPQVAAKFAGQFPQLELFGLDELCDGWQQAQTVHFSDGGIYTQIMKR